MSYGPSRVTSAIKDVMGYQLAPIAICCIPPEVNDFTAMCSRQVRGSASEKDTKAINQVRLAAISLRDQAIAAYVKAKQENDQ